METKETTTEVASAAKSRLYLLSALTKDSAEAIKVLTELVKAAGSKVEKSEDLGPKKLAFPIAKERELTLVSVFFMASSDLLTNLTAELKHTDVIKRFLLTDWKASLDTPKRRHRSDETKEHTSADSRELIAESPSPVEVAHV